MVPTSGSLKKNGIRSDRKTTHDMIVTKSKVGMKGQWYFNMLWKGEKNIYIYIYIYIYNRNETRKEKDQTCKLNASCKRQLWRQNVQGEFCFVFSLSYVSFSFSIRRFLFNLVDLKTSSHFYFQQVFIYEFPYVVDLVHFNTSIPYISRKHLAIRLWILKADIITRGKTYSG